MKLLHLFPASARGKSEAALFVALIFSLLSYLFLSLGQLVSYLLLSAASSPMTEPLSLLGTAAVVFPVFVYMRLLQKRPLSEIYIGKKGGFLQYGLGLFLGILLAAVLVGLLLLFGAYVWGGRTEGEASALPLMLLAYAVQGGAEELLCRGLLMSALCERFGGKSAAFLSAAFFAILHVMNPAVSLLGLLNIFLFGLLFASLTQKTESLALAAAMHAGWNFFISLLGAQVSGNAAIGAQISLVSRAPLWTGGAFGPEASPLLSVLLLLALALLSLPLARKKD